MTSSPIQLTRSQALEIWKQVADGLLLEPSKLAEDEIPSIEYFKAIEYLSQIAFEILRADELSSQLRPRGLMNALKLGGKMGADETAIRKVIDLLNDFEIPNKKTPAGAIASLARHSINSTELRNGRFRTSQNRTDIELNRQVGEFKKQIKQHKK